MPALSSFISYEAEDLGGNEHTMSLNPADDAG